MKCGMELRYGRCAKWRFAREGRITSRDRYLSDATSMAAATNRFQRTISGPWRLKRSLRQGRIHQTLSKSHIKREQFQFFIGSNKVEDKIQEIPHVLYRSDSWIRRPRTHVACRSTCTRNAVETFARSGLMTRLNLSSLMWNHSIILL